MNHHTVLNKLAALSAPALLALSLSAYAAPDWDIVGIRLGMNVTQARAAISAHAPKAQTTDYARRFAYSDGVKQLQAPEFLSSVTAQTQNSNNTSETIEVMFSAPPMEQRVIRVIRTLALHGDPISMDRASASVLQKYGKPQRSFDASGRGAILRWNESGKPVCGDTSPTAAEARLAPSVDNSPSGLGFYDVWKRRKLAPADASNCGAALVAQLVTFVGQSSVNEMKFTMSDPGYAVPAMQATAKQIAEMENKARGIRQQSGSVPKL